MGYMRPHDSTFHNRLELTGEVIILTLITWLCHFTQSNPLPDRVISGDIFSIFVVIVVVLHLLLMLYLLYRGLRLFALRCRYKKQLKKKASILEAKTDWEANVALAKAQADR